MNAADDADVPESVPARERDEDTKIADLDEDVDVPAWIDQDITIADVRAICQGGCASGAYMPAVTYYQARETMYEHGDDVLEYIEQQHDELPPPEKGESWSGIAVHYLSCAVELWAHAVASELELDD